MEGADSGEIGAAPRRRRARRLSFLFARIAENARGDVSVRLIRDELGDRSYAALLVFFAALNLLPLPPPSSAVLGLPLVIVSAQMVYGSRRAWLPDFLLSRSLTGEQFRAVMDKVIPRLERLERFIRPRYWPFWRRQGDRVIGGISLLMAIVVTLPIPLGNWLPAFCTFLLGLALSQRDGVLLALGSLVGAVAMVVIALVIGSAGFASHFVLQWFGWWS